MFYNLDKLDESLLFTQILFSSLSFCFSFPTPVCWTSTHISRPMSNASSTNLSRRWSDITLFWNWQSIYCLYPSAGIFLTQSCFLSLLEDPSMFQHRAFYVAWTQRTLMEWKVFYLLTVFEMHYGLCYLLLDSPWPCLHLCSLVPSSGKWLHCLLSRAGILTGGSGFL